MILLYYDWRILVNAKENRAIAYSRKKKGTVKGDIVSVLSGLTPVL